MLEGAHRVDACRPAPAGPTCRPCSTGRLQAAKDDHPGASDLDGALRRLATATRRRGMVVVISDFLSAATTWDQPLRALGARHEVLAVEIVDRRELELPDVGLVDLVDPETGAASRGQHRQRPHPGPLRRGRRAPSAPRSPGASGRPTPTTWCCAPILTGCSTWCASSPCVASASRHVKGWPHELPRPPNACGCCSAPWPWPRSTWSSSAAAADLRGPLHQPGPARPGRAQATGLAPPHPRRCCSWWPCPPWWWASPSRPARPRCPASGPPSAWPSTPRCRWRPPTSRPTRIKAAQIGGQVLRERPARPHQRGPGPVQRQRLAGGLAHHRPRRRDPGHRRRPAGRAHRHRRGHLHLPGPPSSSCPRSRASRCRPASC